MSEPFLSEIRMVGFNFAPRGWAFCDGQILPINQNQSLYSLLGTTYGGDGRTSFALPDLRGRAPMHFNGSYRLGQRGGGENVPITVAEIPQHDHSVSAADVDADAGGPAGNAFAISETFIYADPANLVPMNPNCVSTGPGGSPHNNMQPYLTINFCIALQGVFPSRN
jgi:microcystin-dependent protein